MKNAVRVSCEAAIKLKLEDLTPLQGNLKALTEANFEKLKRSILRHGVSFPFFCWQHDGVNYILDGTQRDRVLSKMVQEGSLAVDVQRRAVGLRQQAHGNFLTMENTIVVMKAVHS